MLTIQCPACTSQVRYAESLAGKKVKCPKCHTAFPIPPLPPTPTEGPKVEHQEPDEFLGYLAATAAVPMSRNRVQAVSFVEAVVGFFDPTFFTYVTPWVIRITWCCFLVIIVIQLILWTAGSSYAGLALWVDRSPKGRVVEDFQFDQQREPPEIRQPSKVAKQIEATALIVVAWIYFILASVLAVLWVRVFLEMCIVLFDISNSLKRIERSG